MASCLSGQLYFLRKVTLSCYSTGEEVNCLQISLLHCAMLKSNDAWLINESPHCFGYIFLSSLLSGAAEARGTQRGRVGSEGGKKEGRPAEPQWG